MQTESFAVFYVTDVFYVTETTTLHGITYYAKTKSNSTCTLYLLHLLLFTLLINFYLFFFCPEVLRSPRDLDITNLFGMLSGWSGLVVYRRGEGTGEGHKIVSLDCLFTLQGIPITFISSCTIYFYLLYLFTLLIYFTYFKLVISSLL